jgi:hypothetical protein
MKMGRLASLALIAIALNEASAAPPKAASIDGTYELTKRVLANGTTVVPPDVRAIYTMRRGRFSLNLFFRNADGTLASESTIGRLTFSPSRYCEWADVTTRNNIDHLGVTNDLPKLADHCAKVRRTGSQFVFVVPGEGVTARYSLNGFTAAIDNGDRDYWTKVD